MGATIIPLSIDDSIASPHACTIACMATPWLFTVGWTITFAVLFIKLSRVNQLMENARRFRRIKVEAWQVMLPLAFLLSVNVALMIVWTLVDPMYWVRKESGELSSYGICMLGETNVSAYLFGAVVIVNFLALVLALVEAYKAREISNALSESKYIFFIFGSMLQVGVVGVPLIALVAQDPVASYFVKSALVFVLCMSTLLLIFVPKMKSWQQGMSTRSLTVGPGRSSTHPSYFNRGSSDAQNASNNFNSNQFTLSAGRTTASINNESTEPQNGATPNTENIDGSYSANLLDCSVAPSTVSLSKIAELEELMKQQGIETHSLFRAVGIDSLLRRYRVASDIDSELQQKEEASPPDEL